jgi:hypothetical protein
MLGKNTWYSHSLEGGRQRNTSKSELLPRSAWTTSDTFSSPRFRAWAANGCPIQFAHRTSLMRYFSTPARPDMIGPVRASWAEGRVDSCAVVNRNRGG